MQDQGARPADFPITSQVVASKKSARYVVVSGTMPRRGAARREKRHAKRDIVRAANGPKSVINKRSMTARRRQRREESQLIDEDEHDVSVDRC